MPISKKRKGTKSARPRTSKGHLLPMSQPDVNAMILPVRLALEAMRGGKAERREIIVLVQSVILTSFMTEAGFGRLDLSFVRKTGEALFAYLDQDQSIGWFFGAELMDQLTSVVNEHDRQLSEERFGAVADATKRLERLIDASPGKLSLADFSRKIHTDF
jgi:hypothetical protein